MKRRVTENGRSMEYALIRTVGAQARITALPGGQVRLYAPAGLSLRDADALVLAQAEQLQRRLLTLDGPQCAADCLPVEGALYPLKVEKGAPQLRVENGTAYLAAEDPSDAAVVRAALVRILTARMRERLTQRLAYWHARIGGRYTCAKVGELGIKWGACSAESELSFNWRLILVPPEALDYVIIHELCHLHEFSHSERFWRMVRAQMPEYEAWKKWLTAHKSELQL